MDRGDVYLCPIELPNRSAAGGATVIKDKLLVLLQGGPVFAPSQEVALVIASTWRGSIARPFEVLMGPADGFIHDTVVDCRWPYTVPKTLVAAGKRLFTLSPTRMHAISLGLVRGLQMQ